MTDDKQDGAEVRAPVAGPERNPAGWLVLLCWTLVVIGLFWPFVSGQKLVGYRDAIQFYWPMFQWADEVWSSGEMPLWNPYDGLGRSHLGEGISSVFYPGKLLFWARWLSFESRWGWYLALHVWLAGCGAVWCARQLGIDRCGQAIAMFSYGLAGPVLFATTNVVFLVGAAWLPWGLGAVWRWRSRERRWDAVCLTGAFAGLMILGGDPQMAYNLLLIAAGSWTVWAFSLAQQRCWARQLVEVASSCGGLAIVTAALAAVQILPCLEASAGSERTAFIQPRTLVEWVAASGQRGEFLAMDVIWGEPDSASHQADLYEFSQPPWTVGEWVWPGSSGRPFPVWTHWASSLPGSGRMWQPSLYQGVLVIGLAASVLLRRGVRWLVLLGLLGWLAGCGWYGPVWFGNEVGLATGWWQPWEGVNRAVGGVYWILVNLIPGYIWFRYPAKLMMVVSLVLALLAGWAWSHGSRRLLEIGLLGIAAASAILLVGTWLIPWSLLRLNLSGDEWFGPWDAERYRLQLQIGAGQAAVFCLLGWWASRNRGGAKWSDWRNCLAPTLLVIDLLLANSWLLPAVEARGWQAHSPAIKLPVYWGRASVPAEWKERCSESRLEEVVGWELAEAFPRLHWHFRERMLNAPSTIESQDWQVFLEWVEAESSQPAKPGSGAAGGPLSWKQLFETEPVWLLEHAPTLSNLQSARSKKELLGETFSAGVVAAGSGAGGDQPAPRAALSRVGRVIRRTEQSIRVRVDVPRSGVLFLSEAFAPGWRVRGVNSTTSEPVGLECVSVGRWLRGVEIQPGIYELEFMYSPRSVYWGIYLSLATWMILLFKPSRNVLKRMKSG